MRIKLGFFLLSFIIYSGVGSAEPAVEVHFESYEVHGLTAKEIRASLRDHHRRTHGFGNHDALTVWDLRWGGGTQPFVKINITYKMPQWVEYEKAPVELQRQWDKYIAALRVHEDGHRKLAEEMAWAVERVILAQSPKPSRTISRDVNQVTTEYRKRQIEYDRTTQHGKTQGAVFPS